MRHDVASYQIKRQVFTRNDNGQLRMATTGSLSAQHIEWSGGLERKGSVVAC
jgi:hypothetical protein